MITSETSTPAEGAISSLAQQSLAQLRKLEWRVKHAADAVLSGDYRSAFRGRGMEFDQVVRYEYGDDVRDIDWNVTARLGQPYRKKFIEERELTIVLLFEDSPSLLFGSGKRSKREALFEMAALLSLLAGINRDRLAFVYKSPNKEWHKKPLRGRGPILHAMAQMMSQQEPSMLHPATNKEPGDIPWKLIRHLAPRHSLLIWLSDFPPKEQPEFWPVIRQHYHCVGFRVTDPWERKMPSKESFSALDPSTGEILNINSNASDFKQRQREWNHQRERYWETLFPDPSSRLDLAPESDGIHLLCQFLRSRQ